MHHDIDNPTTRALNAQWTTFRGEPVPSIAPPTYATTAEQMTPTTPRERRRAARLALTGNAPRVAQVLPNSGRRV